jgi:protein-L-isoaspartate(D-aspartate) O-methyltransferase
MRADLRCRHQSWRSTEGCLYLLCLLLVSPLLQATDFEAARKKMVADIEVEVRWTQSYLEKSALEKGVLAALLKVPRHEFVPPDQVPFAYANRPLAIGYGQTISQPYIVAVMTDLLQLQPSDRVLEIGTGSGYQAAILAELVNEVYTMEIIGGLASQAAERFQRLKYSRIKYRHGDGYYGWEVVAPFDAIVVTAAADHVPPPLIRQLKPGGRMVIPVGGKFTVQHLVLIEKSPQGALTTRQVLPVQFVPLTRGD